MITLPSHTSHALEPLNVSCFKSFKTSFNKERDNSMVRNNYNEPNKATLVTWVDKALNVALSKKNIKSGFWVTINWPSNPKVMDGRIKPNELYAVDRHNNTLDEDNEENFDETINDIEG